MNCPDCHGRGRIELFTSVIECTACRPDGELVVGDDAPKHGLTVLGSVAESPVARAFRREFFGEWCVPEPLRPQDTCANGLDPSDLLAPRAGKLATAPRRSASPLALEGPFAGRDEGRHDRPVEHGGGVARRQGAVMARRR